MDDNTGLDYLACRIDHTPDGALGTDRIPLTSADINGLEMAAFERTPGFRPYLWKYHQGIPFMAVTTDVDSPSNGANSGAAVVGLM